MVTPYIKNFAYNKIGLYTNKLTYCVRKAVKFENKNQSEDDFLILVQKYVEKSATVHAIPMKTVQKMSKRKNTDLAKSTVSIHNARTYKRKYYHVYQ
jgi:hypothetical protein